MSLLEDIFLQDEANEAQELERIIEGDEYDERLRRSDSDNNSEREDEAEEEKRRVDPTSAKTRRVIKNPRFILNPARLTGPRGMQVIPDHFKDFKFKGKGHEKEDLDLVLKKLEHWAYRLYPKFQFEDCLKKIETLGKKRPVMVHLQKIRTDQYLSEEVVVQKDSSDDDVPKDDAPPEDEFDKLLQQQLDLVRSTPAPSSVKKYIEGSRKENITILPKATSSPSISEEQRERILKSRKLAEERRITRLKNSKFNVPMLLNNSENITNTPNDSTLSNGNVTDEETPSSKEKDIGLKRLNRTNVIDSSDEDDIVVTNESIIVDVHKNLSNADDQTNSNTRKDQIDDHENENNRVENIRDLEEIKECEDVANILTENDGKSDNLENNAEDSDNTEMVGTGNEKSNYEAVTQEITNEESPNSGVEITDENLTELLKNGDVEEEEHEKIDDVYTTEKVVGKDIEDLMDVDFNDDF